MTAQVIYQESSKKQTEALPQQERVLMGSLWNQLKPEQQTQLAQELAELIQRMRRAAFQEKNNHEGT